jgi:hypothetical protein
LWPERPFVNEIQSLSGFSLSVRVFTAENAPEGGVKPLKELALADSRGVVQKAVD